jgi:hypothetical protein
MATVVVFLAAGALVLAGVRERPPDAPAAP